MDKPSESEELDEPNLEEEGPGLLNVRTYEKTNRRHVEKEERDYEKEREDYAACVESSMRLNSCSWRKAEALLDLYFGACQDGLYSSANLEQKLDRAVQREINRHRKEHDEDLPPSVILRAITYVQCRWVGRMYRKYRNEEGEVVVPWFRESEH